MKFTIDKVKLITKLQYARAAELKEIEQSNIEDAKEFEKDLAEAVKEFEAAIKHIKTKGVIPEVRGYYNQTKAPQPKTSSKRLKELDSAISVLTIIEDEQVTLDDRADKWDLINTLKAVL